MKKTTKLANRLALLSGVVLFASTALANDLAFDNGKESTNVEVESNLDQVDPLVLTVTPFQYNGQLNIRCAGQNSGRATCTTTGGVSPYTYSWSHDPSWTGNLAFGLYAGTYSVTVTDAVGTSVTQSYTLVEGTPLVTGVSATDILCYGGTSGVTTTASGGLAPYNGVGVSTVPAGTYNFTIVDANGCRNVESITITEPAELIASAAVTAPILCYGETGEVTVDAVGGTGPYTGVGPTTKAAGSYTFAVTDANGCTASAPLVINQPGQLTASATYTEIDCYGGTSLVTISVMSGTEPYAGDAQRTETAGFYEYTVTDFNGCEAQASVTISQPPMLVADAVATVVDCNGGTATVDVSGSGGTGPWTGIGSYTGTVGVNTTYTVTDSKGCTATVDLVPESMIEANVTPSTFMMDCIPLPVFVEANPTGGVGPYTYQWSNGGSTRTFTTSPNVTTSYDVTVTDANGCSVSKSNASVITVMNRCGNNNQKVVICHVPDGNHENPQTVCISPNALDPHMMDAWNLHGGDYCGPCQSAKSITTDEVNMGSNDFISVGMNTNNGTVELSYRLAYDSEVSVEIYDMTGALVEKLHTNNAEDGQLYEFVINPTKFTSGVYIYQFVTNTERHIDKLHFIH